MLNLSDNELDRLSREAASQHDPGDLTGPQSWEELEVRLDKELGKAGPDVSRGLRGFRRLPFQYAPVLLLIVGITYYFMKAKGRKADSSGSPPLTVVKTPQQQPAAASDSSLKNPSYSDKSTSTNYLDHSQAQPTAPNAPASTPQAAASTPATVTAGTPLTASGTPSTSGAPPTTTGASGTASGASPAPAGSTRASKDLASASNLNHTASGLNHTSSGRSNHHPRDLAGQNHSGHTPGSKHTGGKPTGDNDRTASGTNDLTTADANHNPGASGQNPGAGASGHNIPAPTAEPSGLSRSLVQGPHIQRNHPRISDSALRAYVAPAPASTAKTSGPGLRINRSLTFGLQVAPDFTSVNSLAGDKPGSSIGLTVDYQIFNRWRLGTGLLFSRKNYTARGTDYHVPPDYYQSNMMKGVDFVKGTINMLEIPLNIRYDFSVTGNTIFFASGGISAYLFGNEHCNYYFDYFGREVCRDFRYPVRNTNPLSVANLSLGVETGISNSVSILVAPYMKLPLSDLGFGRIRMNSVGINVAVRYAPVISRKRKH